MGFLKPCTQASWQAASHLVPKDSNSKFRTTIDLRLVSAVTKADHLPMSIVEDKLRDFSGTTHFSSLHFYDGYWQCPLRPSLYGASVINAPQRTFASTPVLNGLKNASKYFQSSRPSLFDDLNHVLKAWINDFTVHANSESKFLDHLDACFTICAKYNLPLLVKMHILHQESEMVWTHYQQQSISIGHKE